MEGTRQRTERDRTIARAIVVEWEDRAANFRIRAKVAIQVGDDQEAKKNKAGLENALKTIEALQHELTAIDRRLQDLPAEDQVQAREPTNGKEEKSDQAL